MFVEKVRDVVGAAPERAVVLCVDEKSQIQALDRTAPIFPMRPGLPERQSHDYKRRHLEPLRGLDITTGKVIHALRRRHRAIEFKKFLQQIDAEVPAHRSVPALEKDIKAWIETWNDDPKPYVWTKTADQILESISRYCTQHTSSTN